MGTKTKNIFIMNHPITVCQCSKLLTSLYSHNCVRQMLLAHFTEEEVEGQREYEMCLVLYTW